MQRSIHSTAAMVAAVSVISISWGAFPATASAGGDAPVADPAAKVDYSGKLTILTKFGLQLLSPYFVNVAKAYEAQHPGVKIELIQENDDSIKGKTKTLVASNSLPDIYFSWTGTWGENFIRGNRAVDLSKVIGPETEWGKTLSPAAVKAFSYNGKNFGVPLYLDAKFMGYNKKMFADLGIEPPKDFDALLKACDALKGSGVVPIAIGNKESWPLVHYLGQLLAYNVPTETLERDFNPKTATFNHPGYIAALGQYRSLQERCAGGAQVNGLSYQTALQSMSDRKAAMYYQEIIEFDQAATKETALKPEEFGFFKLPAPSDAMGSVTALEGAPEGYMVNAKAKNVPLAIDFLKFLTSQENGRTLSAPPYGQPSAVIGGADKTRINPNVAEGMEEIAKASYLMPWLDTVNHPRVAAAWLSGLQAFAGGSMSAEDLLASVRKAAAAAAGQ
ncbi:extracellular solute-binding protein [Rhizobium bangladeshense]|uniref:ABC transporter substrate-binding protein n=1 Tax=Rhizobium bangladeshense TaxID=1138189 RepID=UPI001C838552|nr:extracellular solute-binding protein [Rhizobium bangladeshense]MBX4903526.1 extracellular solute-binding protein [Rhizobium bangladeshense]MBX4920319.1 extracellular solute-binding protein [Rhizobium bangladeshense]